MRQRFLILCGALAVGTTSAATFEVTTTADSGAGSLRAAITSANLTTAVDDISFNIPGTGPFTITPLTALPDITQPLRIDGYTQPGAMPNSNTPSAGGLNGTLMIELSGVNLPNGTGLDFNSSTLTDENLVRGLVINRFSVGISRFAGAPIRIEGCYIGTDIDGGSVPAAMDDAIHIRFAGAERIGGTNPDQRNLISGARRSSDSSGIQLFRINAAAAPIIQGNLIGTDRLGSSALANEDGIRLSYRFTPVVGNGVQIGGSSAAARNLISGNQHMAIILSCSGGFNLPCADGTEISGNYIGTDTSGVLPLPNGAAGTSGGIGFFNQTNVATHVLVGGFADAQRNRISFNHGYGVYHAGPNGTLEVVRNEFNANTDLAIQLLGPRANDVGDPDVGPNRLQNHPVISAGTRFGDQLMLDYRVDTLIANASYPFSVHFYRSNGTSALEYLGEDSYQGGEAGTVKQIVLNLAASAAELPRVTALASDSIGHTSELADEFVLLPNVFADGFE